jgi:acyl-CoA synthetase (AMP-forming)/AMP-acid ligase II
MHGLMQHWPLVIPTILDHAMREHGSREIATHSVEGVMRRYDYRELHSRARRVSKALQRCGASPGDRIGTLAWNTDRHMEIWYGVMGYGAVCHTINPRLFPDQIAYIVNHAQDRILFIDPPFVPLVEAMRPQLTSVERIVVLGERTGIRESQTNLSSYDEWLADVDDDFDWAAISEESAAALCYTSGTTGSPKGVLYSHRSSVLHALAINQADGFALRARDVLLPIVPMFHANAWGLVFAAPMAGAKLVMPGAKLDGASVWNLLDRERVSVTAAVPTVWLGLLQYLDESGRKLPHLRRVMIGGSAVPRMLVERFERDFAVEVIHAWGMTEMSPVGTFGTSKTEVSETGEARMRRKLKQGRAPYTVEMKLVDEAGQELPRDGQARGVLMVRGPAIVGQYYGQDTPATGPDGWFATGDVATIDSEGYMQIVDRSKDVIKSGGEWISSIELENIAVGHPDIAEAAVIGMPHEKWGERPLLLVVVKVGAKFDPLSVLDFMRSKVARWWLPDRVEMIAEIPHTATGKIRKDALRQRFQTVQAADTGPESLE